MLYRQFFTGNSLYGFNAFIVTITVVHLYVLLPDIKTVYKWFVKDTVEHCWIGTVPTHSLVFSYSAIVVFVQSFRVKYNFIQALKE